ncbi:MAG TPA: orc1/cdc6 family replication initiation protein [Candidatus Paceibacterota bacterium]|nr:orc1/cdc6 family replication initiation protein [Candidatus Paceibacterota bacterium]
MSIIKNAFALSQNYKPNILIVREGLVSELTNKVKTHNNYSVFLSGITGTGKTLLIQKTVDNLNQEGKAKFNSIYINCAEKNTFTSVAKIIIETIRNKPYNEAGKTRSQLTEDLNKILKTPRYKKQVYILDEVDKLVVNKGNHDEILFPLLNYCDNAVFILISNDTNILSKLDPRIKSRLSAEIKNVPVYQAGEIFQILKQRAEIGLIEGSWNNEILVSIARFASDVSGDIRFALKLFERTVSVTEIQNKSEIDLETVKEVIKDLENSEFDAVFMSLSLHLKITIIAIALESAKNQQGYAITYPDAYQTYEKLTKNQRFGPVGDRRFRDFLNQIQMLDLISLQNKSTNKRGGRLRIATPNFDFIKVLNKYYYDNQQSME